MNNIVMLLQFQDLATLFGVNITQQVNANHHINQVMEQLLNEQTNPKTMNPKFSVPDSYSINITPEGDTGLLDTPQKLTQWNMSKQHSSQSENRDVELWSL